MNFNTNNSLTIDNILRVRTPLDIFKAYSKHFIKPNVKFRSDFREDPNPSAIISYYNGTYLYKNFPEDGAMNCFQFVSRKFNITFSEVLIKINQDFGLGLNGISKGKAIYNNYSTTVSNKKTPTIITVKRRDFNDDDLIWWGNQSWTRSMLKMAKIDPITHFRLTIEHKGINDKLYVCDDYSYNMDYYWNKGTFLRKLYFPKKESNLKWLSNVDKSVVQGWSLLNKMDDICFITSSFKDCGPFYRIYNKWCAVAPNTEGSFIPEQVFYKLKQRRKLIILWLDSDDTGIKNMKKFSQIYKIPYIVHDARLGKDQSDIWKNHGGRVFRNELIRIMNEKNLNTYL